MKKCLCCGSQNIEKGVINSGDSGGGTNTLNFGSDKLKDKKFMGLLSERLYFTPVENAYLCVDCGFVHLFAPNPVKNKNAE